MEAVYGWVKNIIYYMIFLSVVNNLLADSKYGKYIRFFSGMVLILLVIGPFTGGLHLDEQISSMFRSISFRNDTDDLRQDLWGMEERRLSQVIGRYEQAVETDVQAMAEEEGIQCAGARVKIDGDRDSSRYGQIEEIELVLRAGGSENEGTAWDYLGSRPVNVDAGRIDSVKIEEVEIGLAGDSGKTAEDGPAGDSGKTAEDGPAANNGNTPKTADPAEKTEGEGKTANEIQSHAVSSRTDNKINHLAGKVAQYYGLETSDIKIQWKDD